MSFIHKCKLFPVSRQRLFRARRFSKHRTHPQMFPFLPVLQKQYPFLTVSYHKILHTSIFLCIELKLELSVSQRFKFKFRFRFREIVPGNELPGYSQLSLWDKKAIGIRVPGNEMPGYSQLSLWDKKAIGIRVPGNELPGYFHKSLRDRQDESAKPGESAALCGSEPPSSPNPICST